MRAGTPFTLFLIYHSSSVSDCLSVTGSLCVITQLKRNSEARDQLLGEEKAIKGRVVFWLQTAYAEVFLRWVHLKALRAFVESVLRYGLPPQFMAAIMVPRRGQVRCVDYACVSDSVAGEEAAVRAAQAVCQPARCRSRAD